MMVSASGEVSIALAKIGLVLLGTVFSHILLPRRCQFVQVREDNLAHLASQSRRAIELPAPLPFYTSETVADCHPALLDVEGPPQSRGRRAREDEKIRPLVEAKSVVKVIVVPDKLVNFVVR
jgi:leucyl-tRNA synthetase